MAAHPTTRIKERLSINLLYPQGTPLKLPIKFLTWLLSYGRFLAIVVELIVVTAFIGRFKLDADLADLKEQNNNQVKFIESLSADEALIKQTQFKLATIGKVYKETPDWNSIFVKLSAQIPSGVKINSLSFTHPDNSKATAFRVLGTTDSNLSLASFIAGLKQDPFFQNIFLSNITIDSGQISFTLTGDTKNQ